MTIEPRIDALPTKLGHALYEIEGQPQKISLSDIILGAQDGRVNGLGVILGVAAASSDQRLVIAAGSLIPLLPFLFLPIAPSILISIVITAATLFGIGAYNARTMVGQPGRSGVQMVIIGTVSALAGYFIGALFSAPPTP